MKDPGLEGNEKLEQHIGMLQREPTPEMLAVALTTLRRQMKAGKMFVAAVEPDAGGQPKMQLVEQDGKKWVVAYTSFEEQMKGDGSVQSTFLVSMDQLLSQAAGEESVEGILLNPWHRTLRLSKNLIRIVLGRGN